MILVGTYKMVPKVEWTALLAKEFGTPNWVELYPILPSGLPKGLLSPRLACKLFHDGLFIIKKGEENPKYIQDRIPEVAHKCFKKKQWRKQFFEAMRRVCCRLSIGLGFKPNCVAEDAFIQWQISRHSARITASKVLELKDYVKREFSISLKGLKRT